MGTRALLHGRRAVGPVVILVKQETVHSMTSGTFAHCAATARVAPFGLCECMTSNEPARRAFHGPTQRISVNEQSHAQRE